MACYQGDPVSLLDYTYHSFLRWTSCDIIWSSDSLMGAQKWGSSPGPEQWVRKWGKHLFYLVLTGGNSHFHKHRAKPNPAVLRPSMLLSVLMCSSENHSISSSCGRKSVFAMVTRLASTWHADCWVETGDNNPHWQTQRAPQGRRSNHSEGWSFSLELFIVISIPGMFFNLTVQMPGCLD